MKIVCDACQAKYSISDDKVLGKVFKIRCKKCSNVIVVRGGAGAAEAPAPEPQKDTRVYDYGSDGGGGDEAVWHVVINQDQVGPMTAAAVQSRFAAGDIDAETYAWQEGFADWLPLSQIDAFASLTAAGTTRSDSGDLFTTASGSARGGATDDEGDLFGGAPSRGTGGGAANEAKLRGERNESSVLFSLNNLAKIANDKPAPNAGVTSTPSGHATGQAGGEGSGLIDIRSMANAYLGGSAGTAKPATSVGIGSLDDLPVFGGSAFSEPAVLVPTASRQANNKIMYALIGSVGVLAVAAVILVVVLLGGKDKPPSVQVATNEPVKAVEPARNEPKSDVPPAQEAKVEVPTTPPAKVEAAIAPVTKTPVPKALATKTPTTKPSTHVATKSESKTTPAPVEKAPPAPKTECDEVSCLLNPGGACCGTPKPKPVTTTAKPTITGNAPDALDRTMINDGMNKVKAKAMACGSKSSAKGQVKVSVKVNPGGDIASVTIKETPDQALGACVTSAVQKARFAKTVNGGSFSYPFGF